MLLDTTETLSIESHVAKYVRSEWTIRVVALRFETRLYPGKVQGDDFVCVVHVQTTCYPDEPFLLFTSFAKLFRKFRMLHAQRVGHLLCRTLQRLSIDPFGIEKQRNGLNAASKLAPLAIEKFSTLRAGFD